MAVVHILLLLLWALPVDRVSHWVITVAWRLLRRRTRGIYRLNPLRRGRNNIVLGVRLIYVVRACCDEEQCAAQPYFLRKRRQLVNPNPARRLHNYVASALWAIPVTTGIEIVLSVPANTRIAPGYAVDHITRTALRA